MTAAVKATGIAISMNVTFLSGFYASEVAGLVFFLLGSYPGQGMGGIPNAMLLLFTDAG